MTEPEGDNNNERAGYENKSCKQLKLILRERGLQVSGTKAKMIDRILGQEGAEPTIKPIAIDQHIVDRGHGELERARLEQKKQRLLGKTNIELKTILKARGQRVGGKKDELIDRLLGIEKKKVKSIEKSCVPKLLRKEIFEENDLEHSNSKELLDAESIYHSCDQYSRYSLEDFTYLLDKLREEHKEKRQGAAIVDKLVLNQLAHVKGMEETTVWGYQSWRNHPGKPLLRQDMALGKHLSMEPKDLYKGHIEYADLPLDVFRKRIAQEELRIKQNNWNTKKQADDDDDSRCDDIPEWSDGESSDSESEDG